MKVGVVIPTVPGRERIFENVLKAYEDTTPKGYELDLCIVEGFPTVGEAWNDGAQDIDADYIHFGIDDALPHDGWLEAAVDMTKHGNDLPAARIVWPDGTLEACGSMGLGAWMPECGDWTPCRTTGIPFMRRGTFEAVGPFAPIHFYVDDDWYWKAAKHNYQPRVCRAYSFTHHYVKHQGVIARSEHDKAVFLWNCAGLEVPA